MKQAFRLLGVLTVLIATSSSVAVAVQSCKTLQAQLGCPIGTWTTCSTGDEIRNCQCVAFRNGRWLC